MPSVIEQRVLHCYAGNLYGGIETFLATLARQHGLASASAPDASPPSSDLRVMAPEFALCFGGRLEKELQSAGVMVHRLEAVRFRRPWTVVQARRQLARLLVERSPDIVVCHACWPHALFGPVVRRSGWPLVFWMHDRADNTHWIERRAARTPPDFVVVNSRSTAETLPHLFPGVPHEVLYYPVAPPPAVDRSVICAQVRRELNTAADATVIIQASRLEPWKGHSLLIAALGHLRDRAGWVAWLAGGAQRPHEQVYLEHLEAEARSLGIADRVRFLGQRSDVPHLLAAADIHCQPNTSPEPFGIAFVEALYAGLPVVSTRLGGAAEIVTEACGILVPPADSAALADALGNLIDDPSTRARLGSVGPERARHLCDPAAAIDRLHGLLVGVLNSRSRDRVPVGG
jgi:glycosyltransferase involved in cell wall biosynthesis